MKINKAYKVELKPNNKQKTLLEKSCGVARFAYNWGLEQRINLYKNEKKSLSYYEQHKLLCAVKEKEFPWMYDVSKMTPQGALNDLDKAFKNFFRGLKKGQKVGFPKFKSKHKDKSSFSINSYFYLTRSEVKIPKIGSVKLKERDYIPIKDVHINSMTVSKDVDRWFISVQVEEEIPDIIETDLDIVGIDLGSKVLATCSDGVVFDNPKYLRKYEKQLKFRHKMFSKKKLGSKNREKSKLKLQKVYRKIRNCRKDYIHKMTSILVRTKPNRILVVENLNIKGMLKNHKLAKSIGDASFYEIKRQLKYKSSWYGGKVIEVDTFFPSSKLCSNCGYKDIDLTLKDRVYECPECGLVLDRDLNASYNLRNEGLRICTESSLGS